MSALGPDAVNAAIQNVVLPLELRLGSEARVPSEQALRMRMYSLERVEVLQPHQIAALGVYALS